VKEIKIIVSNGEIVDKITILQIKLENIKESVKLENIKKEFDYLYSIMKESIDIDNEMYEDLLAINKQLWDIEDKIRDKERNKEFDNEFIELARSVYFVNDKRSEVKKRINLLTESVFVEEKSYKEY